MGDILDSGRFATVRLTEIFRQARESLIVTNAHAINEGTYPNLGIKNNDFFYLYRRTDREIAETVVDLCKTRLPRTYGKETEGGIQIITPSRKGEAGTENLNRLLQASLNPETPPRSISLNFTGFPLTFAGVIFPLTVSAHASRVLAVSPGESAVIFASIAPLLGFFHSLPGIQLANL